jgi:hypothetical protein
MAPIIDSDIHRELGKIQATLDEILRRLDKHAETEEKMDLKITKLEHCFHNELEKTNSRVSAIETKFNYGLGVIAGFIFIFEVLLKFIKV